MYELEKREGRENRSDKTDIKGQNTICKIRENTICNTICKIRENTLYNIREIINDTMKQENIDKIKDMIVDTMKQHTMNRCDITREDKTDEKIGNNKRDSMQHILQVKTKKKKGKNRREKIIKKQKRENMQHILQIPKRIKTEEKRENMQHILQIPKRLKTEESDFLHRISQLKTGG